MAALDPKKKERFAEPVRLGCTQHATQGVGVHAPRQSSTLVIVAACRLSRILRHACGSRRVVTHALDLVSARKTDTTAWRKTVIIADVGEAYSCSGLERRTDRRSSAPLPRASARDR
jgi:hypothetical protein